MGVIMINEFRKIAIETAIYKLFNKKYFDICTLNDIIKLINHPIQHNIYAELQAFHCVNYSEMCPRTKELLQEKVVECLRGDNIFNPARVINAITDEGNDFTFTEDRYIDTVPAPKKKYFTMEKIMKKYQIDHIYKEGYDDYMRGVSENANPYVGLEAEEWLDGWEDAKEDYHQC